MRALNDKVLPKFNKNKQVLIYFINILLISYYAQMTYKIFIKIMIYCYTIFLYKKDQLKNILI